MSQDIINELEVVQATFLRLFPEGGLLVSLQDGYLDIGVHLHGSATYADATEIFRRCGVQKRDKQVYTEPRPRMTLEGSLNDRIKLTVYVDALSPTCRVEKVIERIPKQETRDTGEFVEVERIKVTCGVDHEAQSLRTEAAA